VTIEYDITTSLPTLRYRSNFIPINAYKGFTPTFKITNGTTTATMTLDYTGLVLTYSGSDVEKFNNTSITVLDLYNGTTKVSQINSFIVNQTSKISSNTTTGNVTLM
jgi:hypothetical protein